MAFSEEEGGGMSGPRTPPSKNKVHWNSSGLEMVPLVEEMGIPPPQRAVRPVAAPRLLLFVGFVLVLGSLGAPPPLRASLRMDEAAAPLGLPARLSRKAPRQQEINELGQMWETESRWRCLLLRRRTSWGASVPPPSTASPHPPSSPPRQVGPFPRPRVGQACPPPASRASAHRRGFRRCGGGESSRCGSSLLVHRHAWRCMPSFLLSLSTWPDIATSLW